MARPALPAAPVAPCLDYPCVATTRGIESTALARQVAAIPALRALRRAVCGADQGTLHPQLEGPLARFEAAGDLLARTYAATLAYLAQDTAPAPEAPTLLWLIEEYSCADTELAEAIENRVRIENGRAFTIATRLLSKKEAGRHRLPCGAVRIHPKQ